MKRRTGLGIAAALIGVVAGCVLLELISIAWLTIEDGTYSSAQALYDRAPNSFIRDATRNTGCTYIDDVLPHPYLAYVHHGDPPCGFKNTNNVGLYGRDFPTRKLTDKYVVLLTGGSVAAHVGQSNLKAPRFLEEALNRRYVSPNGKPFLVLDGAEGGWKEPQQFILFSMYAQLVDGLVVLDGYNEYLLFSPKQRMALEMPASNFAAVNPLFRGDFSDAVEGWMLARIAQAIADNPLLGHSHAGYLLYRSLITEARRWDVMQYERGTRMDTLFALPKDVIGHPDRIFAEQLKRYQGYDISMAAVAAVHQVKAAFFLQPVPAWGKTLTDEEKRRVGDQAYLGRYRELVSAMMSLRQQGLAMYDLGDIFQAEQGTIYDDPIHCMYQEGANRGYAIMAARMAENIAAAWNLQARP